MNKLDKIKHFFLGCKHTIWIDEFITQENKERGFVDQFSYCDVCKKYNRKTRGYEENDSCGIYRRGKKVVR